MKTLLLCSLLLLSVSVLAVAADNEKQLLELEVAISQRQQEQQILFQQFQMVQELRRHEIAQDDQVAPAGEDITFNGEAPKYEDLAEQRRNRIEKIHRHTDKLNELYARYQEIENERQALIEQLSELKVEESSPVK